MEILIENLVQSSLAIFVRVCTCNYFQYLILWFTLKINKSSKKKEAGMKEVCVLIIQSFVKITITVITEGRGDIHIAIYIEFLICLKFSY